MKKCAAIGLLLFSGYCIGRLQYGKRLEAKQRECEKYLDNYQMLNHWLAGKSAGSTLAAYFEKMGYRSIAIYGMGDLANRIFEELKESGIEILYGIDKDVCNTASGIAEVYAPDETLPAADAVIVTPFYDLERIRADLEQKVSCPVVSLEEAVWSM